jgi:AraC-like DNA-binding protein/mannose-6-phosphate isomerase-like protein (cupin superfamily)
MKDVVFSGQIPREMVRRDYECHHFRTPFSPVPLHFHDFYEVFFLLSDAMTYLVDGRTYTLNKGEILLINPHEMHSPQRLEGEPQPYDRIGVYISPELFAAHSHTGLNLRACFDRCAMLPSGNVLRPGAELSREITETLRLLQEQDELEHFGASLLREMLLVQLLIYLNRASLEEENILPGQSPQRLSHAVVDMLIRYIDAHLSEPLSLEKLAEVGHMSKYHLVRLFRQQTGLSPIQYLRYKRLLRARRLLREDRSVTSVCHECGFSDYANFIRAFKKEFGISPGRYARQLDNQSADPFETMLLSS